MLEHIPAWIGALLRTVRAGHAKLAIARLKDAEHLPLIELSSSGFVNGGSLPLRFTADGEGVSPPLAWHQVPDGTVSLALLVEDADAPAPSPLVHALVWNIPPTETSLAEGVIASDDVVSKGGIEMIGRNSFLRKGWLAPDPPFGHGAHDYVFQIFALSKTVDLGKSPGRGAFLRAIEGNVIAGGLLVASYSRDEATPKAIKAAGSPE